MIVDLAIIASIGTFTWRGWRRGLVASLSGLAGFIAAAAAAVFGYRALARTARALFGMSDAVANLGAAVVIFLGVSIAFWAAGRTATRLLKLTTWGTINAAGGAALSGVWALSWVTAILLAVAVVPAPAAVEDGVHRSLLARGIVNEAPRWAMALARTDVRRMLEALFPSQRRVAIRAARAHAQDTYIAPDDGSRVVVRTYLAGFEWAIPPTGGPKKFSGSFSRTS